MSRVPPDWPLAQTSRFTRAGPHDWHVQEMGAGPLLILIHGAGGGTQSFRHLAPLLARDHRVVMFDLPGQGFTRPGAQRRFGLDPMAEDIATLMQAEGWRPEALVGHSAGAALALRLAEMGQSRRVVGINPAISNFSGVAGVLFPLMAKVLAALPFVAEIFTANANRPGSVERLIAGTGSTLPPEDLRFYRHLVSTRAHVAGTLSMMAQWQLDPLLSRLPEVDADVLLITGGKDKAVPPKVSVRMAPRLRRARHVDLPAFGHLVHEEAPDAVADLILTFLADSAA